VAIVRRERDPVDRADRAPVAGWLYFGRTPHLGLGGCQNRKYRCAIGSTSAGAQVNSSPSARTS
jgi:hypothetical protein